MFLYAPLESTWVVIEASRVLVQKDGPYWVQVPVAVQFWSYGTSGQCAALLELSVAPAHLKDPAVEQRPSGAGVKTTFAAGLRAPFAVTWSARRCPYPIEVSAPPRM